MDLKLDIHTHDLVVGSDAVIVTGKEALQQRIKVVLLFFFGEWFLDKSLGVDWFGTALVKSPNMELVDNMIIGAILEDPEVETLLAYTSTFDKGNRSLTIEFTLQTAHGEITLNERIVI